MEFLNNIWTFLNTENAEFINISSIPILFFIEIPLTMYMFIYALNIPASRRQKILYVILASLVGTLSNFVIPSPYNVVFNYGMLLLIIIFIFKQNLLKSCIAMILPTIIFVLLGNITLNPFLKFFNVTYDHAFIVPIYRYSYLLVYYGIILSINLLLKYKNIAFSNLDYFDKNNRIMLYTNLLLGLVTIILQLFLTVYYLDTLPIFITFISSLSLLAYFFISIYSLNRVTKLVLTTQALKSAEEYNKSLSILYDNVKGFKHDFDNIVSAIGGYVKTNDIEGLNKYYHQLEEDCQRVNNISALNPNLINNPGVYNLLSIKYHKADSLNIKINLEFFLDLSTLNMKIYEFTRILGILLDNAIESASECDEKQINIKFRNEEHKHRQLIIVENTYNNKDIDLENIFNKGVSGKQNHSGLGLWEIKQILNKNNNLTLYTTKNEKFFKQQLEIYY